MKELVIITFGFQIVIFAGLLVHDFWLHLKAQAEVKRWYDQLDEEYLRPWKKYKPVLDEKISA